MRRLHSDARGSVYVETLVAFLPVFTFFLATLQLADASVAQLVVDHASAAAARAAVVVLPDDGQFYEDRDQAYLDAFDKLRRDDVELAADLILRANPRIASGAPNVKLGGTFADRQDITATVTARYDCLLPTLCGGGWWMKGESKLVYQGAKYTYEDTTAGKFKRKRDHPTNGKPVEGDPPKANEGRGDEGGRDEPRDAPKPKPSGPTKPVDAEGRPQLPIVGVTDDQGHMVEPRSCFVAGTKVSTPAALRDIESLAAGDTVFAYDEVRQQVVASRVVQTFVRKVDVIYHLTVRSAGGEDTITGTATHPFYVPGVGYMPLAALRIGQHLLTLDGARAEVIALTSRAGEFEVFNFEVEGQHNYFVHGPAGSQAVLVHNLCPPIQKKEVSKARENFRDEMRDIIAADPDHPLRFLLEPNPKGGLRFKVPNGRTRGELQGRGDSDPGSQPNPKDRRPNDPVDDMPWYVEAGHATSGHSGDDQFLGLQDAFSNQLASTQEGRGVIYTRPQVLIGGVPVEYATALEWVEFGVLDEDVLKNAPRTPGWDVQEFVKGYRERNGSPSPP